MIVSGGENIDSAEVENVMMKHPDIADVAVFGVPDSQWGETVRACVVLKQASELRQDPEASGIEIVAWIRDRLAHFKCPRRVDFVEQIPRSPSGKILKRILREPYWRNEDRQIH
ncbi:MAG: hypothetical protein EBU15_03370 [Betaproteobacteria bacterium]|nr:hypothetical protein [Betaproteobacteria bacterium]